MFSDSVLTLPNGEVIRENFLKLIWKSHQIKLLVTGYVINYFYNADCHMPSRKEGRLQTSQFFSLKISKKKKGKV